MRLCAHMATKPGLDLLTYYAVLIVCARGETNHIDIRLLEFACSKERTMANTLYPPKPCRRTVHAPDEKHTPRSSTSWHPAHVQVRHGKGKKKSSSMMANGGQCFT